MAMILLVGCKSKKVVKDFQVQKQVEKMSTTKDSIQNTSKLQEKEIKKDNVQSEQKKDVQTEITIKGKADTDKPVELHNIKDGDTLESIRVIGNAEVFIHSRSKSSNTSESSKTSESISDKLKDFSQTIIKENNVRERVDEFKKRTQEVKTTTGTFWSLGLIAIVTVTSLVIVGILIYFKKYRS